MQTGTTTAAAIINNMQQHQQHYMSHISQDHLMPEQHHQQHHQQQQQVFTHLSSTTTNIIAPQQQQSSSLPATTISLNEGLYSLPHLTSEEGPHQYYSNSTSRLKCNTSASSSSSSSSSSNDSNYPCSTSTSSNNNNNKNDTPSIGVNLRVTGQCSQGGRKYMEDYFSVAYQQSQNAKDLEYAFIGIYDGHGGAEAAKFAKEHLMMEIINQRLFWSDNDHDVLRAIREGYIATHYAMWREQEKWPKTANGLPSTAGTTATVAFIRREKIYIGHVGDSGIVLGYQNENENFWRAKQLTTDHKPESVEERTRIMNSGGKVVVKSGVPRVVWNRPRNASHRGPIRKKTLVDEIPFLAVARSLGDLWSYNSERNEFVVSPDPDVKVIPINPNTFRCLIFGTDGLWNVVSAQESVNTVREKEVINERLQAQRGNSPHEGNQWTNPSKSLVEQALKTWSAKKMRADNTSVVTVILHPPGQGDLNSNNPATCKETCALTNPPSFVQPISYGLEYSQMQAEAPAYDDATTYKEMALKYLPPEAYRNFNYYADESDAEEADTDESEEEDQETPGDLYRNHMQYKEQLQNNSWNWQNWISMPANDVAAINQQHIVADCEEEDEDDDEDMEEEEDDEEEEEKTVVANEREVCIVNYQNYVHMEAEETNNATDSYINTFTESYNTILTATSHGECATSEAAACSASTSSASSSSNSNSNSNCQSVTPPNGIHDILQEQHLYQQQCMSEEDGYSLTKLETRREQQTLKTSGGMGHSATELAGGVPTFKIFHDAANQINQNPAIPMYTNSDERFYQHHHPQQQQPQHQFMPQLQQQQKPLELHSLLQQEREEEQQVAFERLQMESKLAAAQQHQSITAYACLQAAAAARTTQPAVPFVQPLAVSSMEEQPALEEEVEYLEEEIITETAADTAIEQDESVQIHEISSSSCGEDSLHNNLTRQEEETFVPPLSSTIKHHTSSPHVIEKLVNVEILQDVIFESSKEKVEDDIVLNPKSKSSLTTISKSKICLPPPSPLALTPIKSSLTPHTKRSKSYLYPNVPNENLQRISQHSIYSSATKKRAGVAGGGRRSICITPSGSSMMTPPAATSTPMIQRQLRSTTTPCSSSTPPTIDYGKRTLRTRNSLAKDMKAKSSIAQAALKYPHNAVSRSFLRTTAASLLQGKTTPQMILNDSHLTVCSRRSLGVSNAARSVNRGSIKASRRDKERGMNQNKGNLQHSAHHLNLRSRQTPPSSPTNTNSSALRTPPPANPSPVLKRASLQDRRSLRTIHTRSSSSKGSQTMGNFSKPTRTQSTGSNLAAPPPSPKMINAAAAVAAATRARSLLSAKHAAVANGTQSVVSAVFGKRTSLRSNGTSVCLSGSSPGISSHSSIASSTTHQTLRGRIVKKLKR